MEASEGGYAKVQVTTQAMLEKTDHCAKTSCGLYFLKVKMMQ